MIHAGHSRSLVGFGLHRNCLIRVKIGMGGAEAGVILGISHSSQCATNQPLDDTRINEPHQDPNMPVELDLRRDQTDKYRLDAFFLDKI